MSDVSKEIQELREQNEALLDELSRLKSKPRGRIGYFLLAIGGVLFAFSIDFNSHIIAFASLALLFWGGIFLFVKPTNYVRQELLFTALSDSISNYEKLLDNDEHKGRPYYIAPQTLSDFKTVNLIIPKEKNEEIKRDISTSSVQITPIGLGLAKLLEQETKVNFSTISLERVTDLVKKVLIDDLELVKGLESAINGSDIQIKIVEPVLNKIDSNMGDIDKNRVTDGYLVSALACILAISSRQPVIVEKVTRDENGKDTTAYFKIHQ